MYNDYPIMEWETEYTDQFEEWWNMLRIDEQSSVSLAVEALEEYGPALGRPFVDTIKRSRHQNMKELRPPGGAIGVRFAFDPIRTAILLLGGDKMDHWKDWYEINIPKADQLYDEHLRELQQKGEIT